MYTYALCLAIWNSILYIEFNIGECKVFKLASEFNFHHSTATFRTFYKHREEEWKEIKITQSNALVMNIYKLKNKLAKYTRNTFLASGIHIKNYLHIVDNIRK